MSYTVGTSQKKFELIPEGSHMARCISIIDLGTQTGEYKGRVTEARKVRITWETPTETRVFNEEKGEQPFVVSREFTASLGEKANLRKVLESWRGKAFTEDELKAFDLSRLIGKPCILQVIHQPKKDGSGSYVEVRAVTSLMKGAQCPDQINPSVEFSFENFDQAVFDSLPDWLREKIQKSPEFRIATEGIIEHEEPQNHDNSDDLPF